MLFLENFGIISDSFVRRHDRAHSAPAAYSKAVLQ